METATDFNTQLEEILKKYREYLEGKVVPKLREDFRIMQSVFENIYNLLLRKALIKEDPYKYEQKFTEVTIPPSGPLTESEKQNEMSHRLANYHLQLDFINTYYQLSLDFLNINRIKKLVNLIKYIDWPNLAQNATNATTATLCEYLERIKKGSDKLATGIVSDAEKQLAKLSIEILKALKALTNYHRENYKFEIRSTVLPKINFKEKQVDPLGEEAIKLVKRTFAQELAGKPFYPELIKEILAEEYSEKREELQKKLIERLKIPETKKISKKKKEPPLKETLLEGLYILSGSRGDLEAALKKLKENSDIIEHRKLSLGEKFKRWIMKTVYRKDDSLIYEVEIPNVETGTTRKERINFTSFTNQVNKKIQLLSKLSLRSGVLYHKLREASEEQIFDFLTRQIQELEKIHKKMEALNIFFMSETPREERDKLRGIKIELSSIKNHIIKSNKKKYDYISIKEEREQLKKLGVEDID